MIECRLTFLLYGMDVWICRLKDCHGIMYKKLAGECASIDTGMRGLWLERLAALMDGNMP
jgi:hypothetical protein